MSSKLRIRIGEVEIDCEGTEEFLKAEFPKLLTTVMALHKAGSPQAGGKDKKKSPGAGEDQLDIPSLTTGSIAARLGSNSGSDLLLAAAAHLALVKNVEPFSRQQLLAGMREAKSYFKKNYAANLSKYVKTALLRDGPLSETATDSFALKAATRTALEKKLAHD